MNEQDLKIQKLTQEVARWKGRALEAAARACDECEQVHENCESCRIWKIKEEAGNA